MRTAQFSLLKYCTVLYCTVVPYSSTVPVQLYESYRCTVQMYINRRRARAAAAARLGHHTISAGCMQSATCHRLPRRSQPLLQASQLCLMYCALTWPHQSTKQVSTAGLCQSRIGINATSHVQDWLKHLSRHAKCLTSSANFTPTSAMRQVDCCGRQMLATN